MPRLNQIIAIANGQKSRTQSALTQIYHKLQKEELFQGLARSYRSRDAEGEQMPSQQELVKYTVGRAIEEIEAAMTDCWNVVATQDYANCIARGDVKIGDEVIIKGVPAVTLIYLEKQLQDLANEIGRFPTLDAAEEWGESNETATYATPARESVRTKKVPKSFEKYPATKEHPAQVEMYHEDVVVGYWETIKYSGAIPEADKSVYLSRIHKLQDAVKAAREEANGINTEDRKIAEPVFRYLFS